MTKKAVIFFLTIVTLLLIILPEKRTPDKDIKKLLRETIAGCLRNTFTDNSCAKAAAAQILAKYTFVDALSALERIHQEDNAPVNHTFLHFLSSLEYQKHPDFISIFKTCDNIHSNACYHGVASGFVEFEKSRNKSDNQVNSQLLSVCGIVSSESARFANCIHSVGHAFMIANNNDLPQALNLCGKLSAADQFGNCYDGVFMENFPGDSHLENTSRYLSSNDPIYPCDTLEKQYLKSCYLNLTHYFIYQIGYNPDKLINKCNLIPADFRDRCYFSIGGGAQFMTSNQKLQLCNKVPDGQFRQACIAGAVGAGFDRFVGSENDFIDKFASQMLSFCALVSKEYKRGCYQRVGNIARMWVSDNGKINKLCSSVEDREAVSTCLGAN